MSNTKKFAEIEFDMLLKSSTPDNRPVVEDFIPEILALVDKFGNSGQSGGSAPYVASTISETVKKLCLQKPICPITGIDEEWADVYSFGGNDNDFTYQNKRCSALFKSKKNSRPYYLDAIVWKDKKGNCWSGIAYLKNEESIRCRQYIKSFPFEPKTFYIDIVDIEVEKDDWKFFIKDEEQLKEVFKYYSQYDLTRKTLFEKIKE